LGKGGKLPKTEKNTTRRYRRRGDILRVRASSQKKEKSDTEKKTKNGKEREMKKGKQALRELLVRARNSEGKERSHLAEAFRRGGREKSKRATRRESTIKCQPRAPHRKPLIKKNLLTEKKRAGIDGGREIKGGKKRLVRIEK